MKLDYANLRKEITSKLCPSKFVSTHYWWFSTFSKEKKSDRWASTEETSRTRVRDTVIEKWKAKLKIKKKKGEGVV